MRFADASMFGIVLLFLLGFTSLATQALSPVHGQRYCMGTMFDIVAYHSSRLEAERAIDQAMEEIIRLDQVMSHFKADSDLSKLNREARTGFVKVDPSLYEVIDESIRVSRRSAGKFDVTIAPLLKVWKDAHADGRSPSDSEISDARRCVGYERIELDAPDRIRFHSDCLEIELGGIGKGYAVDRAIAVLKSAGIRHAVVNAGSSSIASIGSPPGGKGWPVRLGASASGKELLLRDASLSTSEQNGEIIDPHTAAPTSSQVTVTVMASSAALADALSTTLLMMSIDEGAKLLDQFAASVMYQPDAR
jgi:thiamine biosynthesis lipoprotein